MSGFEPDHVEAEVHVSPNFGVRAESSRIDCVILHYTGMVTGESAEAWLCDPVSEVSSHYLVYEDGHVVQMVRERDRAWHAGKSSWSGVTDINSCSIGIEIVNPGHAHGYVAFPEAQIESVIAVCRGIIDRHGVRVERFLAHSDVAPGRKVDPGELFPWARLASAGIGHFVAPAPIRSGRFLTLGDRGKQVETLQSMLSAYGYGIEIGGVFDVATQTVVAAFQRHFRPEQVDGVADLSTMDTLERLLEKLPAVAA